MDAATAWKLGITVFGIFGTLAVILIGIMINRLYKSIDLLFQKIGEEQKDRLTEEGRSARQIGILKLAALKNDPDGTALFEALAKNGGDHK